MFILCNAHNLYNLVIEFLPQIKLFLCTLFSYRDLLVSVETIQDTLKSLITNNVTLDLRTEICGFDFSINKAMISLSSQEVF